MDLVLGLDVKCCSIDLPIGVKGLVKKSDGVYYIYINNKLCEEEQCNTVAHELEHIRSGDLETDCQASAIERYNEYLEAHKNE